MFASTQSTAAGQNLFDNTHIVSKKYLPNPSKLGCKSATELWFESNVGYQWIRIEHHPFSCVLFKCLNAY